MARKGHSKITESVRKALHTWVIDHPRVVNSPITNDTILVLNPDTNQKERVGKLLLEIPIRELHNDLIEPPPPGRQGGGTRRGAWDQRENNYQRHSFPLPPAATAEANDREAQADVRV